MSIEFVDPEIATPPSLMDNPKTNGDSGICLYVRGDWHNGYCTYWNEPASAGKAEERINEIAMNTVNNSANARTAFIADPGQFSLDSAEFMGGCSSVSALDHKTARISATIIEVYGNLPTPKMIVRQYDILNTTLYPEYYGDDSAYYLTEFSYGDISDSVGNTWRCCYERKFVQYGGNKGVGIDTETWSQKPTLFVSED